jgi:hypothetical protein
MKQKQNKIVQGRNIGWKSNAKIAEIRVHDNTVICKHEDGVTTTYPAKGGLPSSRLANNPQ